jgi:LPXTG-site transpeptidase (sortase) family protein
MATQQEPRGVPRRRLGDAERPLRAAGRTGLDRGLLVGSTEQEILHCFLGLVRSWRGSERSSALPLRRADVDALVSILGTDEAEIERRLVAATACNPSTARRCRRLLLASVATISIGLTGSAGAGAATYETHVVAKAPAVAISAGAALTVAAHVRAEVADPAQPTANEAVVQPEAAPPATPAVTAEIAAVPEGTEAILTIPSVGIDLPVIPGGQSVIDQGVVAHYTAPGWEPPVAAGAPGTYWLAAHHDTHGGPFADLPEVAIGAEVRVTANGQTFVYTVTSKEVVGLLPGDEVVYGTDPGAPVVLLQTCIDSTRRALVHGILTSTG